MPYSRRTTRRYTKPPGRHTQRSKPKTMSKPYVVSKKKTYVAKASRVKKIEKQVWKNKRAIMGSVQKNFQVMTDILHPSALQPIIFDVTDFTCAQLQPVAKTGARAYQLNTVTNQVEVASAWTKTDFRDNVYWSRMNQDRVDTGKYLPIYCKVTFRINASPSIENTRIRFDLVSFKPNTIIPANILTGNRNLIFPSIPALSSIQHLATPSANRINSTYFKKYATKWVFINSAAYEREGSPTDGADTPVQGTTGNIEYCNFTVHPKKVRHQALTAPVVAEIDDDNEIADGDFGPLNVPIDEPLWVIVSCDKIMANPSTIDIQVGRVCIWRDPIGQANL